MNLHKKEVFWKGLNTDYFQLYDSRININNPVK
jgi:hypothetical protein